MLVLPVSPASPLREPIVLSACLSAAPELSDPDWSPSDVPPELPPEPLPELLDPPAPETPALETIVDLDTPVALTLRF